MNLLARAFETNTLQINADPGLERIRESVILNQTGKGMREGVLIEFDASQQLITFHCKSASQALMLAEAIKADDYFQNCIIVEVPRRFFLTHEDGTPRLPIPTDRED